MEMGPVTYVTGPRGGLLPGLPPAGIDAADFDLTAVRTARQSAVNPYLVSRVALKNFVREHAAVEALDQLVHDRSFRRLRSEG